MDENEYVECDECHVYVPDEVIVELPGDFMVCGECATSNAGF